MIHSRLRSQFNSFSKANTVFQSFFVRVTVHFFSLVSMIARRGTRH